MKKSLKIFFFFIIITAYGQAPSISYSTPNTFSLNQTVNSLFPNNVGGTIQSQPIVSTLAGSGAIGTADEQGAAASFNYPTVVTLDHLNNVIVVDRSNHKIRKITPDGQVTTIAGLGSIGATDGTITTATFRYPDAAVVDSQGNIFISDQSNHKIRKIDANGMVTTFAGTGTAGYNDGIGASAMFYYPAGIAIDSNDNLYIADYSNHKIRKISPQGIVSTYAGASAGDADGSFGTGRFNGPTGVCVDAQGVVYVADYGNHKIKRVLPDGYINTIAGTGTAGATDGIGSSATFYNPAIVAVNNQNELFVTDEGNHKIRKIDTGGTVSTYAGTGEAGDFDAKANSATFNNPTGLVTAPNNIIYVCDYANHKIRKIQKFGYTITPDLPNGLSLDAETGEITGTPTTISPMTDYTVAAVNQFGTSVFTVSIEVQDALNTQSFQKKNIVLYPNPVKDKFVLTTTENMIKVEISNVLGQCLKTLLGGQLQNSIDVSGFHSGVYNCRITTDSGIREIKFLKQ